MELPFLPQQNTYRCSHTNATDTPVPEKQTIDQDTIPTKPTKTTDSWTNADISNNNTDHASQDGYSLIVSQLHHPDKEIKPKRIKENQSREICHQTKELKKLDPNHKYRNTVNKKAVAIIGNSILNGIDQHGLSNESFNVRVKNYPEATTEDMCDHLKSEIRKKPDLVIIQAGANDLTNNGKSLENFNRMTDSVRSKLPNCKLAISNVITRKDNNEIDKKVETFNIKLSKFYKNNKIDIMNNKNSDDSCLNCKQLHLNRKGNSYLANNFLDYLDCV